VRYQSKQGGTDLCSAQDRGGRLPAQCMRGIRRGRQREGDCVERTYYQFRVMERNCSDILAQAAYVKYLKNGYVEQEK